MRILLKILRFIFASLSVVTGLLVLSAFFMALFDDSPWSPFVIFALCTFVFWVIYRVVTIRLYPERFISSVDAVESEIDVLRGWSKKAKTTAFSRNVANVGKVKISDASRDITDDEVTELYELVLKVIEDEKISKDEAYDLFDWFVQNSAAKTDVRTAALWRSINLGLRDGILDKNEKDEIFCNLTEFCLFVEYKPAKYKPAKYKPIKVNTPDYTSDRKAVEYVDLGDLVKGDEYRLRYTNAEGFESERDIVFLEATEKRGYQYIKAVCLNQNGVRTFRADRVNDLMSLETGEIIID